MERKLSQAKTDATQLVKTQQAEMRKKNSQIDAVCLSLFRAHCN
jgi:hypothetical protein